MWKPTVTLPEGPLDFIGDVHGEINALRTIMLHLGYDQHGEHPQGRTLVFLGDLIDRGPDSPGVVRFVFDLLSRGRAVCVMGNHDLNAAAGLYKADNAWLFGHKEVLPNERSVTSQKDRNEIIEMLSTLPLAAQRSDVRAVHACWRGTALAMLADSTGPVDALRLHKDRIKLTIDPQASQAIRNITFQNENPVKVVTSGPEAICDPFFAGGKMRCEDRIAWWNDYVEGPLVVVGHYWRIKIMLLQKDDRLFAGYPLNSTLGAGQVMCIDYSVGSRAAQRRAGVPEEELLGRLACLRWPEQEIVFDDGERMPLIKGPMSVRT